MLCEILQVGELRKYHAVPQLARGLGWASEGSLQADQYSQAFEHHFTSAMEGQRELGAAAWGSH